MGNPRFTPEFKEDLMSEEENEELNKDDDLLANPISACISNFVHCLNDAQEAASIFVPLAIRIHNKNLERTKKNFDNGLELSNNEKDPQAEIRGVLLMSESFRNFERIDNANVPETLEKALFLNLFSDFDTFTGELLLNLYIKNPELMGSINKNIPLSDVLNCEDFEELKQKVINDELENFRRKSYVDQFDDLEKRFGVNLRKFDRWSEFVETTQRRNIFMHCNGLVTEQYISICKSNGVKGVENLTIGEKLEFEDRYIFDAIDLLAEVSVKLGHVLWRKLIPNEEKDADDHFAEIVYGYLQNECWHRVIHLSDFALNYIKSSTDVSYKINLINSVIAHKFSNKNEEAIKILQSVDWSAASNDFKLAECVLTEKYEEASEIMLRIGKEGELLREEAYHEWPLFRDFRHSPEFIKSYGEVYGYSFVSELKRTTQEKQSETEDDLDSISDN